MSPSHQSGRRRYAERAAAETATSTPAVGHQRASDKRIQISAAEAEKLIAREATKHSPGPWHVDGDHVYADVTVDGQPCVEMIASILFPDNGPLIAAAPDLLEAAELAVDELKACLKYIAFQTGQPRREEDNTALRALTAAITKAGGTP